MWEKEYKNAYDQIQAEKDGIYKLLENLHEEKRNRRKQKLREVVLAVIAAIVLLVGGIGIAVSNDTFVVYAEEYIPNHASDTENGVVMTVESVFVTDSKFCLEVSFSNVGEQDFINPEDVYNWYDFSAEMAGEKLEFEEVRRLRNDGEKLRYWYTAQRNGETDIAGETVSFWVKSLFTLEEWSETLDLTDVETVPDMRVVKVAGADMGSFGIQPENDTYPYEVCVLNMIPLSEVKLDGAEVTGAAYVDGILRIQMCLGNTRSLEDVVRVGYIDRYDENQNKVLPDRDGYVHWFEEINGKRVEFMEYYYMISENEARELPWTVEFLEEEGCLHTMWSVEFELEK